ncbi:amino acid ABC transporter permease [Sporanaerobium hydrogeniformans]|uniref:Amino acid ABC transporter permease n=1 Tax=Sporanaerobium hydrogeniformans TaxID=3072179 RepID=A0AC61D9G5_9FIRM|nr:ABC transporter permease [Sporanaerobium hydrogeniformans]PHV69899.1 amino acid ABC transporter permease [Sporanaerobium hydrogeniformans]
MQVLLGYIVEHVYIVLIASLVATGIGILLGVVAYWVKYLDTIIIMTADSIQTIPSLALLAMLMICFGLGNTTLIVGLVLYSLLPIIRNTYNGLNNIPPSIHEAARGMGMSKYQRLVKVELPLAFPMIFSGVKIAVVTAIGISVIGVLIGAGGLGYPVYRGIQSNNLGLILQGAIPVVGLAILFDLGMGRIEKQLLSKKQFN